MKMLPIAAAAAFLVGAAVLPAVAQTTPKSNATELGTVTAPSGHEGAPGDDMAPGKVTKIVPSTIRPKRSRRYAARHPGTPVATTPTTNSPDNTSTGTPANQPSSMTTSPQ